MHAAGLPAVLRRLPGTVLPLHLLPGIPREPFLSEVRRRFAAQARWNPERGWLTPTGCGLAAGRPPVCYEFLCRTILEGQPSPLVQSGLAALAMLLTHAGRKASGRRHLVELTDLGTIHVGRLARQLAQARSLLIGMRERLEWGQAGGSGPDEAGGGAPSAPSR
jgi:hypothetical protein